MVKLQMKTQDIFNNTNNLKSSTRTSSNTSALYLCKISHIRLISTTVATKICEKIFLSLFFFINFIKKFENVFAITELN